MKIKLIVGILVAVIVVAGFFVPVESALIAEDTDEDQSLSVFEESEEEESAKLDEEATDADDSETDEDDEEEEEETSEDALSSGDQSAYEWAAHKSSPESIIMTPERITTWNTAVNEAGSTVDILSVPEYTADDVSDLLEKDLSEAPSNDGTAVTDDELEEIEENEAVSEVEMEMTYGILTNRTNVTWYATDLSFDNGDGDQNLIAVLSCATPVWVMHESADGSWYYVQSSVARGWVPAEQVALTDSVDLWTSYADPTNVVLITAVEIEVDDGVMLDMGCLLACVEEGTEVYSVQLPTRGEDGTLEGTTVEIDTDDCAPEYLDYTWIKLLKACYAYTDVDMLPIDDMMTILRFVYRVFNISLPAELDETDDSLGTWTFLSDLSEEDLEETLKDLSEPSLLIDADGVGLCLGYQEGVCYKLYIQDGALVEAEVNEPEAALTIGIGSGE